MCWGTGPEDEEETEELDEPEECDEALAAAGWMGGWVLPTATAAGAELDDDTALGLAASTARCFLGAETLEISCT